MSYDTSKLNQKLVAQARQGSKWDHNDQARYDALLKAQQKSAPKPAPKPSHQQAKAKAQAVQNKTSTKTQVQVKPPMNSAKAPNNAQVSNQQQQSVQQDNDINTTINGDNNKVFNEQDNSIRQYGGDNRSFTYNAGKGGNRYEDTPVSAATMGGFYDVNDSPGAQAGRFDMWSTMNRDAQKRYAGDAMKTYAKYGNIDAREYTAESMENTLNRGVQYSFDRADRQTGHVFGDIWNDNYITEDWKMPSAPEAITSNAADIADKAKEDIEDI